MSGKERVFGERGKGMKPGFRKCSQGDVRRRGATKTSEKNTSHKENDNSSKLRRPTKRTFTTARKVAHHAKCLYGQGQGQ